MKILKKIILKFYHLICFLCLFILFIPNVHASTNNLLFNTASFYNGGKKINTGYGSGGAGGTAVYYFSGDNVNLSTEQLALNLNQTHLTNNNIDLKDYNYLYLSVSSTLYIPGSLTLIAPDNSQSVVCLPYSSGTTPIIDGAGREANSWSYAYSWTTFQCDLNGLINSFTVWDTIIGFNRINTSSVTSDSTSTVFINKNVYLTKSPDQEIINELNKQTSELKDSITSVDDTLNDGSVDSSDDTINNLNSKIPTNSVISDLLLLPVRFLQNFVNALGSSCTQFSLGSLYGTELFMPCINIENYLGSGIWTTIDLIISGLFIYALRKKFIEIYENLTNLKNGGNEVD